MIRRTIIVSLCLIATSVLLVRASRTETVPARRVLENLPFEFGAWKGQRAPDFDQRVLTLLGVEDHLNRFYLNDAGVPVFLYVGYHESQKQGDTIHSPLNCLPGAGWNPVQSVRVTIPVARGAQSSAIEINRIVIQKGLEKQVVLYWYQSHGRVIASEYWGKIFTVIDAVQRNRTDAAMVRVISPVLRNDPQAEEDAERYGIDFVRSAFPLLSDLLPQ